MGMQVEKLEGNMAKLTIEVPAEELEKELQAAYMRRKGRISLPGFRRGKVPRAILEKMYGPDVFCEDAAGEIVPAEYEKAYDECDLEIVSSPKVEIVKLKKGEPFVFTATVATKPPVTLGKYKGLEVEKADVSVTDKEVDEKIENERKMNSRKVSVTDRGVKEGDEVVLDFDGSVDGKPFDGGKAENYTLKVGSKTFIPGFEEQLVGAEIEREVDVNVTFPEDYQQASLAGKKALFKCVIHEIKAEELPDLDDEFASEVSEFDTLSEYRDDIRAKMLESRKADADTKKENDAVKEAVKNASIDIPQAMLDTETDMAVRDFDDRISSQGVTLEQYLKITGQSYAAFKEKMSETAEERIRTRLTLEAVAAAEGVEITDEKISEELEKMAERYNVGKEEMEKAYVGERREELVRQLTLSEAAKLIADAATEVEKKQDAGAKVEEKADTEAEVEEKSDAEAEVKEKQDAEAEVKEKQDTATEVEAEPEEDKKEE